MTIRVSVFDDVKAQSLEVRQLTVEDLAALIGDTQAPDKQHLPLLKLGYFGDWRTSKGSLRHDRNMHFISGVEMDYDGEEVSFEDAVAIAEKLPLQCIIYTSPSHRTGRPRWRLIAPCSQELPATDRRRLVERINGAYGGIFSSESWTLSQAFYFGRDTRNPNFDIELVEGEPIDQLDELDLIARPKAPIIVNGNGQSFEGTTAGLGEAELAELIRSGAHYHEPTLRLATIRARRGDDQSEVVDYIENLFDEVPAEKQDRERWKARRSDVHRCVADMFLNVARDAEEREARLAAELAAREAHWPSDPGEPTQTKPGKSNGHARPGRILTGSDFVASFVAPDWLIDGILQRGRLYACTSLTGHGKTAVWLYVACMIAAGRKIGHLETEPGNVLILAGENPEDLKARMLGMGRAFNLKPEQMPYVLPGSFPMTEEEAEKLRRDIDALGVPFALIIPDTAASYFPGDDENSNVQAGNYARILRTLTTCSGNPAVVLLAHPIKNAGRDNLLPRGGGAFLNEMDGNLTLWSDELGEMTSLHWHGKIRGPDFDPLIFRLKNIETGRQDKKGRPILTIAAQPIDDMEAANQTAQTIANENAILKILHDNPKWSLSQIAREIGWVADPKAGEPIGEPQRYKVTRTLQSLSREKLVRKYRKKWAVTEAGKKALEAPEDG